MASITKTYNRQYHTLSVQGTNGNDFYDYERNDRAQYRRNGRNPAIWVEAGDGNDRIYGSNEGWETMHGEGGNDFLWTRGGGGQAWGGAGNDFLLGGAGTDSLLGGTGNDRAYGGRGNDYLRGDEGNDRLYGGRDDDQLQGGLGNDVIHGGQGSDTAIFGAARSRVRYTVNLSNQNWQNTGEGRDKLTSIENVITRQGNDLIVGNSSSNNVRSGSGNDVILGMDGNDEIKGERGNDLIVGGKGFDKLYGGQGADTFFLSEGSGFDRIMDFRDGQDRLQFGAGVDNLSVRNRNGHAFVYEGRDLLAVVNGAAGDLQVQDNFLV